MDNLKKFLFLSSIMFSVFVSAQANVDFIKKNPEYIWGIGKAKTLKQATDNANRDLTQQISSVVEVDFKTVVKDYGDNIKEFSQNILKTYSNVTLQNTTREIIKDEPDAEVFLYMPKQEIVKIFEQRKDKLKSFATEGFKFLKKNDIGSALKNFYWSLSLLITHKDQGIIKDDFIPKTQNILLKVRLQNEINQILSNINIDIQSIEKVEKNRDISLLATYKGKKIATLDVAYWEGSDWSASQSFSNGQSMITLYNSFNPKKIKFKVQYDYQKEAQFDKELYNTLNSTGSYRPFFGNAIIMLPNKVSEAGKNYTQSTELIANTGNKVETNTIKNVLNSLKNNLSLDKENFDKIGLDSYNKILGYGKAKLLPTEEIINYSIGSNMITRAIPMYFSFPNNYKNFSEKVVFSQDTSTQKINYTQFAISDISYKDIMFKGKWPDAERKLVIDFIEKYKTAYALENIKYLKQVFSEDALIVVGSKLKSIKSEFKPATVYRKVNKKQYINSLEQLFKQKEYVNIAFEEANVKLSKYNSIYGVSIVQNYTSSNYSDKGYLFLVIDLRKKEEPKIHVRTWQDKDDFKEKGPYGLQDFF